MTNKEWLDYLAHNAPDELSAWFDAERTESPTSATMQQIGQVIENTVKRGVYGDTEPENEDSRDKLEADMRDFGDSREKLEAEASELVADYAASGEVCDTMYNGIIELLDRQASITSNAMRGKIDELTAERDKLQEQLLIGWECECSLQAERDELKRQMDTMRDVTREFRNERERYRSKFGKCLDYADAIHALMDDEGMA